VAETNSLLNCRTRKGTGGSNPPLSAINFDYQRTYEVVHETVHDFAHKVYFFVA